MARKTKQTKKSGYTVSFTDILTHANALRADYTGPAQHHPDRHDFTMPDPGEIADTNTRAAYAAVCRKIHSLCVSRVNKGLKTYGTATDTARLSRRRWTQHRIEELVDALVYAFAQAASEDGLEDRIVSFIETHTEHEEPKNGTRTRKTES